MIKLIKNFFEDYFKSIESDRYKTMIYKKNGINQERFYTYEEIGILEGVSKQRIHQIESKIFSNMNLLMHGSTIKSKNYKCDEQLVCKTKEFLNDLKDKKTISYFELINKFGISASDKNYFDMYLKILVIKRITLDKENIDIILSSEINKYVLEEEITRTLKIVKKNILPISKDDIIIQSAKRRRKKSKEYILLSIEVIPFKKLVIDNVEYLDYPNLDLSVGDSAYKLLWIKQKRMGIQDIKKSINKDRGKVGDKIVTTQYLSNQLVAHPELVSLGNKEWGLKNFGIAKISIKDLMKNIFYVEAKPLTSVYILEEIKRRRGEINEKSVISYLSQEDFYQLDDGTYIISDWKRKYTSRIKPKRVKTNYNEYILKHFKESGEKILTFSELWSRSEKTYSGTKYNFKNFLKQRKYLQYHKDENTKVEYFTLTEDRSDLKELHGNKTKTIEEYSKLILRQNNGEKELSKLINLIQQNYHISRQLVYQFFNKPNRFFLKENRNGTLEIKLMESDFNIKISEHDILRFLDEVVTEEGKFDFKQGFLTLDPKRKFDKKSFEKIMMNMCAMANHGKNIKGRILIGIADKTSDTRRIEELDNINAIEINGFGIVGVEREAKILKMSLEDYLKFINEKINDSGLPDKLKLYLKSHMQYVKVYDKTLLILEAESINGISFYKNLKTQELELYIRKGPQKYKVNQFNDDNSTSTEFLEVQLRCTGDY